MNRKHYLGRRSMTICGDICIRDTGSNLNLYCLGTDRNSNPPSDGREQGYGGIKAGRSTAGRTGRDTGDRSCSSALRFIQSIKYMEV